MTSQRVGFALNGMNVLRYVAVMIPIVFINQLATAFALDWPMFGRDGTRNAVSPEKNAPLDWEIGERDRTTGQWLAGTSRNIRWAANLGTFTYSDPVVSDGLVWIGTNNQNPRDPEIKGDYAALMCFRERDGEFLWQRLTPAPLGGPSYYWTISGQATPPLIENNRLWYTTIRGAVVCLDIKPLKDGSGTPKVLWTLDMPGQLGVRIRAADMGDGRVASIAGPYRNRIYVITGNGVGNDRHHVPAPEAPSLVCLDKDTGKVLWSDNSPGKNILFGQWGTPTVIEVNGRGQVLAPQGDGWLRSFDALTGKLIWEFDINPKTAVWTLGGRGTRNYFMSAPVYRDSKVYIASGQDYESLEGDGRLVCLDPTRTGDISSELALGKNGQPLPHRRNQAVDLKAGERTAPNPNSGVIWEFASTAKIFENNMHRTKSTVALAGGLVIAPDFSGLVHCLDAKTGKRYWVCDVYDEIHGSPLIVDDKVYVAGGGGLYIFGLSADPKIAIPGGKPLAELLNDEWIRSSPIFANGVLYFATRSTLFAVAEKGAADEARQVTAENPSSPWPQFFGPQRNNHSQETNLLDSWPEDGPPLVWKAHGLGNGLAPPAVANGRIFTTGNRNDNDDLVCLEEKTGKELWAVTLRKNVPEYRRMRWLNQRTPTIDEDRVYAISEYGDLVCADIKSGREVWRKNYETDFNGWRSVYGYCDYPLIAGERLICTTNGTKTTHVALDKKNGKLLWQTKLPTRGPGGGYSAGVLCEAAGVRQFVQLYGGTLIGLDPGNGRLLWQYNEDFANPAANAYVPIVKGDHVFCGNCYHKGCVLLQITKKGDELIPVVKYRKDLDFQYQHSCTTLVNGKVYASLHRGKLGCLDLQTGELGWVQDKALERDSAAQTFADGHLYLHHRGGVMTLVKADPSRYIERGRFTLPLPQPEPHYTYPVIANGRMLIRHDDVLLCYDVRKPSQSLAKTEVERTTQASPPPPKQEPAGGYWPQWRGPNRDNISNAKNLLQEWPKEGPPLEWKAEGIGKGISSLSIADGRIVTLGYQGQSEYALALDEDNGELLWATRIGPANYENGLMRWLAQRVPTLDKERAYVLTYTGELVCLDVANGRELWRKRYMEDFGAKPHNWGVADYPLVDGDRLICAPCGNNATLVALDARSGKIVWQKQFPEVTRRSYAAAVMTKAAGVKQYVAFLGHQLVGVSAEDGGVLWSYDRVGNRVGSSHTPIVIDDYILASGGYGTGFALLKLVSNKKGIEAQEVYFQHQVLDPFTDPTIQVGEQAFTIQGGRILTCFDWKTGKTFGKNRITAKGRLSLTYADGRLYFLSAAGEGILVENSQDGPQERGRIQLPDYQPSIGATNPVVAGGQLYLRDDNRLYCFDVRKADSKPAPKKPQSIRIHIPGSTASDAAQSRRTPKPIFVPTPEDVVQKMLELAAVSKKDTLVDLGSGDGRIVIAAAKKGASKAIGYEIDKELVAISQESIRKAGLAKQAEINQQDMYTADLKQAGVIAVFLYPVVLEKLKPQFAQMKPGSRVVSHQFEIPGAEPDRVIEMESKVSGNRHRLLLYTTPLKRPKPQSPISGN